MDLLFILIAILFVVVLYLIVKWVCAKVKLNVDDTILQVGAIILLILLLVGKVKLPF